jgi:hypothetical protein
MAFAERFCLPNFVCQENLNLPYSMARSSWISRKAKLPTMLWTRFVT